MATFFKVKMGDKVYELDRLTLGNAQTLKQRYGLVDLEFFSPTDPDVLVGLMTLAIQKSTGLSLDEAEKIAQDCDIDGFEDMSDAPADAVDPQPAADDEDAASKPEPGKSGKRPKSGGSRTTPKS